MSVTDDLFASVTNGSRDKYVTKLTITNFQGLDDVTVSFDFPVTAIVGPNGAGKSTIVKAAALAYKAVAPRSLFPSSQSSKESSKVALKLIDRSITTNATTTRTASLSEGKWSRTPADRDVRVFDLSRVIPFGAKQDEATVSPEVAAILKGVLALPESSDLVVAASSDPGVASALRIIAGTENAANDALILIEEIEAGLHPQVAKRLCDYLIKKAAETSIQVIFSTSINEARAPLPSNAIWAINNGLATQGKLTMDGVWAIAGNAPAKLAIFVETFFAEEVIMGAFRAYNRTISPIAVPSIKIHGLGEAKSVLEVTSRHNARADKRYPAVAILQGASRPKGHVVTDSPDQVLYFPGNGPLEDAILDAVLAKFDEVATDLTVAMALVPGQEDRAKAAIQKRRASNTERRFIFDEMSTDLDFSPGIRIQRGIVSTWARCYPDQVMELIEPIIPLLPKVDADFKPPMGEGPTAR